MQDIVDKVLTYYKENNLNIPTTVPEYILNYPPGFSRQVLKTKYNLTTAEFLKLLNPHYTKPLSAKERACIEATRLGYEVLSDLSLLKNNRDKLDLRCLSCGKLHTSSISSMSGSKLGCPYCKSGNLPWNKREQELRELLLAEFNSELISNIPSNQLGYITVKHVECDSEYTSQLVGFVSPNTPLRATCPNCRSTDKRVVVEGITFGSVFESECYMLLKNKNPEIHVKYSKYFDTDRHWVCDFKIDNIWIEVSNFKQDFKGYFANIEAKQAFIESNGHSFFFVQSLIELKDLVELI